MLLKLNCIMRLWNRLLLSSDIDCWAVSAQPTGLRLAAGPSNIFQPPACIVLAGQPQAAISDVRSSSSPTMQAWGPLTPSHNALSPQSHQMLQDLEGYCLPCSAPQYAYAVKHSLEAHAWLSDSAGNVQQVGHPRLRHCLPKMTGTPSMMSAAKVFYGRDAGWAWPLPAIESNVQSSVSV